jgi:acetyl/propionyl-CoA carboxylase alpha subunit
VIEETPSTVLTEELRNKMGAAAVEAIRAVNYDSVGTVEFLLDDDGKFYFLEVNTRIQVEHPITELTTGIDLLKLQIDIANGKEIPYKQSDITQRGHAIECRVYAEDAEKDFIPTGGKVLYHRPPTGLGMRYDTGITTGSEISPYYDPIMSKIISYGSTREEAIERMKLALKETVILGVKTSMDFMYRVLCNENFIAGNTHTNFLEKNPEVFVNKDDNSELAALVTTMINHTEETECEITPLPWQIIGEWEIGATK